MCQWRWHNTVAHGSCIVRVSEGWAHYIRWYCKANEYSVMFILFKFTHFISQRARSQDPPIVRQVGLPHRQLESCSAIVWSFWNVWDMWAAAAARYTFSWRRLWTSIQSMLLNRCTWVFRSVDGRGGWVGQMLAIFVFISFFSIAISTEKL